MLRWVFSAYCSTASTANGILGRPNAALRSHCLLLRHVRDEVVRGRQRIALKQLLYEQCGVTRGSCRIDDNPFLRNFLIGARAKGLRRDLESRSLADRVRLRKARDDGDTERQGNLIILKRPYGHAEKGVILVKYSPSIEEFAVLFDLAKLGERYRVVLEPSWAGIYEHFFFFIGQPLNVLIQCPFENDFDDLRHVGTDCCKPIRIGAGDWVDSRVFAPPSISEKRFDIVMVANWSPMKRHAVLFRALRQLRPKRYRVALVGFPWHRDRSYIECLVKHFHVEDGITIFEQLTPTEVANVVGCSKVSLVLSRREGAIKAAYESLFCNTPILLAKHNIGFNREHINSHTGRCASDDELPFVLSEMIEGNHDYQPRRWALCHTGYGHSTLTVNGELQLMAAAVKEAWTHDLVEKTNRPHLRYVDQADHIAMNSAYEELASYIRSE
jgi:glycosyltransferase involved in cell wall biosynthesis